MEPKNQVNYLYFTFLFIGVAALHSYHVLLIERGSLFSQLFFLTYAIAQSFMEVAVLVLIGMWLRARFRPFVTFIYIALTFLLFISHILDFPMVRLMDMSVWYTLNFIWQESSKNFKEVLYASNVSMQTWLLGFAVAISLFGFGALFFFFSEKLVKKFPVPLLSSRLMQFSCGTMLFIACFDIGLGKWSWVTPYDQYQKALPWKTTFFPLHQEIMPLAAGLKSPRYLDNVNLTTEGLKLERRPNIFLFITESLRADSITEEVAPNLSELKKECVPFDLTLSNANATHLSWFSIFYSQHPFYWNNVRHVKEHSGSVSLQILKKLGYKIHVYTSARLAYYRMDEVLFGNQCDLLEDFYYFAHERDGKAYLSDEAAVDLLCEDLSLTSREGGHVFIVFLDSTHFDYSFPCDKPLRFSPIIDKINYLKVACSKENLACIKNRYFNAIHFVDSLFGRFTYCLKEKGLWDNSLIVFTGDHGEEFYDHGHIFHASELSNAQTQIPILYKFTHPVKAACTMTSHVDIFPTILHDILGKEAFTDLFDGQSIFCENRWPFVLSTRYNASRTPCEFVIHNGKYKLLARMGNTNSIFKAKNLRLLSLKDRLENRVPYNFTTVHQEFGEALERLFPQ